MTPGSTAINLRTRSLIVGAVLAGSAAVNGCGGSTGPSIASLATGSSRCVLSDFKTVSSGLSDNVAPSAPTSAMVCRLQNGRHLSQRPIGSQEAQLVLDKINDLPKLSKGASRCHENGSGFSLSGRPTAICCGWPVRCSRERARAKEPLGLCC
jgi:hypothetical protein